MCSQCIAFGFGHGPLPGHKFGRVGLSRSSVQSALCSQHHFAESALCSHIILLRVHYVLKSFWWECIMFSTSFCRECIMFSTSFCWECIMFSHHSAKSALCSHIILLRAHYVLTSFCRECITFSHHSAESALCSHIILLRAHYVLTSFCRECIMFSHHSADSAFCSHIMLLRVHCVYDIV